MNLKLMINIKDIDKNGKVIREKEFEANSLVKGFIALLCAQTNMASPSVQTTDSNSSTFNDDARNFRFESAAGSIAPGIVVGTGTNAVDIDDYKLQTIVAHGVGAGQLQYAIMELATGYTVSGSDAYFEIRRAVNNNSGGDITINEIGLYSLGYDGYVVCIDRTLSTTTVTNGNGKVITYKFQVTV